jgi:hypothetical protein
MSISTVVGEQFAVRTRGNMVKNYSETLFGRSGQGIMSSWVESELRGSNTSPILGRAVYYVQ